MRKLERTIFLNAKKKAQSTLVTPTTQVRNTNVINVIDAYKSKKITKTVATNQLVYLRYKEAVKRILQRRRRKSNRNNSYYSSRETASKILFESRPRTIKERQIYDKCKSGEITVPKGIKQMSELLDLNAQLDAENLQYERSKGY